MMVIANKYKLRSIVYLRTDVEQLPRMIVAIIVTADDGMLYELICGANASKHYECELTNRENQKIKLSL